MLSRLDMAGAFGVAAGFVWCVIALSALFLDDTMYMLAEGQTAQYLAWARMLLDYLGFFPGLVVSACGGAACGWALGLLNFDFTEF